MIGGRAPKAKGSRFERALVRLLQDHGLASERVPLSGAVGGRYSGDLTCPLLGVDRTVECKSRKDGFRELYSWLQARDLLVVKSDRRDALVVLPLKLAVEIAMAAERGKSPKIQNFPVPFSAEKNRGNPVPGKPAE
jgi:Holliday junction resolvase